MSGQAVERDIIARPPVRAASLSRRQLGLAGAALLVGIGAAWYGQHWWTVGRFIETTDDAYVGGDVTVIAPKVAGLIADVAVTDNQAVRAGDLLLKLDDRDYRAYFAFHAVVVCPDERRQHCNVGRAACGKLRCACFDGNEHRLDRQFNHSRLVFVPCYLQFRHGIINHRRPVQLRRGRNKPGY